jgi:hypothetical protein
VNKCATRLPTVTTARTKPTAHIGRAVSTETNSPRQRRRVSRRHSNAYCRRQLCAARMVDSRSSACELGEIMTRTRIQSRYGSAYCWNDDVCPLSTKCVHNICCHSDRKCMIVMHRTRQIVDRNHGCHAHEFTCSDGACVHLQKQCDRQPDCPDGSDEWHCQHALTPRTTPQRMFMGLHVTELVWNRSITDL